jgi:hypothetical protein
MDLDPFARAVQENLRQFVSTPRQKRPFNPHLLLIMLAAVMALFS